MTVYTTGTFDVIHEGHINLLRKCRLLAGDGKVLVGVSTDDAYKAHKGKDPILSYNQRKETVLAIRYVDGVLPHDQREAGSQIKYLNPDIVVKGTDWVDRDLYTFYGIDKKLLDPILVYAPYTEGISSTKIKEDL